MDEYRKPSLEKKDVFKGAKNLLLKNSSRLKTDEKAHLTELLRLNQALFFMVLLKAKLKTIWKYKRRGWARRALNAGCAIARLVGNKTVGTIVRRMQNYAYGLSTTASIPFILVAWKGLITK
jgi:transposase